MKKPIFGLLAVLAAGSAFAQWNLLGRNENLRIYLDQSGLQRNGDLVRLWQLYDYVTAQWVGTQQVVYSVKSLVEYDCAVMRSRTVAGAAYSEPMAAGRLVVSDNQPEAEWSTIPPGGAAENIWKIACGKS